MAGGVSGGFGAIGGAGLVENVADVMGDRAGANVEFIGDRLVAVAGGDKPQHLHLPLCQSVRMALPFERRCDCFLS